MKKTVTFKNGKEISYTRYSKREIKNIVLEIENGDICISEAAEKYDVAPETIKDWLRRMSTKLIVETKQRHPEEIKKTIVRDIEAGIITIDEACLKMNVYKHTIVNWIKKFSIQTSHFDDFAITKEDISDMATNKEIDELKLKIIALETMIDVAEKELNIDIRKKSGTRQ